MHRELEWLRTKSKHLQLRSIFTEVQTVGLGICNLATGSVVIGLFSQEKA